ncbi:hypothetical protein HKX69_05885 [Streptomyces argyrophyllae]|uniref:Uncharacterized protein n=1 Tax=Streptomyces argyrophylli TaxID=2726118 RepID=A0A6M4PFA8_9ACTN|nr:hypothetical protein [Streptomyces argyrophyllae]QJS09104.1 hypothetical protein HKX69_05885 [Streptomyces argyrophyllae]
MSAFVSRHGVRIYSLLAALVPVLLGFWPNVDWEAVLPVAAVLLGAGEVAQRHEDAKTRAALYESSPWDEAAARQEQLAAEEASRLRKAF